MTRQYIPDLEVLNDIDPETANPTGGYVHGMGTDIHWQDGPTAKPFGMRNGAFVEDIIEAARQRLEFFQHSRFADRENANAIVLLEQALECLERRRIDRVRRGVYGTYQL